MRGQSGLCEHHLEHDADCGYAGAEPEMPCAHEHDEDCYRLVTECVHEHTGDCYPQAPVSGEEGDGDAAGEGGTAPDDAGEWEPEDCSHVCSEESGCITGELSCRHEHDMSEDGCGYRPARAGISCSYVCGVCGEGTSLPAGTEQPLPVQDAASAESPAAAVMQDMTDGACSAEEVQGMSPDEQQDVYERLGEAASGDFGSGNAFHWSLKDDGTLTITGTGTM